MAATLTVGAISDSMDAEPQTVNLNFRGESGTVTTDVHHLGGNRYQIVDPLVFTFSGSLAFHDVVEAEFDSEDRLIVRRVVEVARQFFRREVDFRIEVPLKWERQSTLLQPSSVV